jgi:hypothetical protein
MALNRKKTSRHESPRRSVLSDARIDLGAGSLIGKSSGLSRAQADKGMRTIIARIGGMGAQPSGSKASSPRAAAS